MSQHSGDGRPYNSWNDGLTAEWLDGKVLVGREWCILKAS